MTAEITVADKLKQLFQLQLIDSEIDQIHILKGELPMEVQDLEDELGGLQTRINRLTEGLNDMKSDVSRHNAAIAEATTLIEKYKKQMDNVKNNREYDALNKEIQMQELDIKLAEKRIREGDGQLTNKEETLKAAQERYDLRAAALETKKVELEKIKNKYPQKPLLVIANKIDKVDDILISKIQSDIPEINQKLNDFPKNEKGWILGEENTMGQMFVDVITGKSEETCPLDEAIISDTISHMGDIAIRTNRKVTWDPEKGKVLDDEEANSLYIRKMREPFKV